jgi:hypothetical protein
LHGSARRGPGVHTPAARLYACSLCVFSVN